MTYILDAPFIFLHFSSFFDVLALKKKYIYIYKSMGNPKDLDPKNLRPRTRSMMFFNEFFGIVWSTTNDHHKMFVHNLTMLACQNGQTKTHVINHGNTASSGPHSGPIDVPKIQPTGKLPGTLYSFLKIRDFPGMLS